jgi:hypothetical protein
MMTARRSGPGLSLRIRPRLLVFADFLVSVGAFVEAGASPVDPVSAEMATVLPRDSHSMVGTLYHPSFLTAL